MKGNGIHVVKDGKEIIIRPKKLDQQSTGRKPKTTGKKNRGIKFPVAVQPRSSVDDFILAMSAGYANVQLQAMREHYHAAFCAGI